MSRLSIRALVGALAVATTVALQVVGAPTAAAVTPPRDVQVSTLDTKLSHLTMTGSHNSYVESTYSLLTDALVRGDRQIELDVWPNSVRDRWYVSHSDYWSNDNNCIRDGIKDRSLGDCLTNIRSWHDSNPLHDVVLIKIELKSGFDGSNGFGPKELDALLASRLGSANIFKPSSLRGGYATLDAAARADNWPTRRQLQGKFIVEVIPGTFELDNPFDSLHTDVEYARHLRDLAAAGLLHTAMIFPAVLGAANPDPRNRYEASLRPWFVVFDGSAATYVNNGLNTAWYDTYHYLVIMTSPHAVSPALHQTNPDPAAAQQRIRDLAARHASIVSSDWTNVAGTRMILNRG